MRRPWSIRTQLLALAASLLVLVAVGQLAFGALFARSYFLHQKKQEIQNFYGYIRDNYTDNLLGLYTMLQDGEDVKNIRVAIFNERGLIYTSRPVNEGYGFEVQIPNMTGVVFSQDPKAEELPARNGEAAQLRLAGMFSYSGGVRYVVLWVPVESIESSVAVLNRASVYIVAAVMAVGLILGVLFARKISRPLQKIQQVSLRASQLDFSAQADENAPVREVASLARSINQMSRQLSQSIEDLRLANQQLQADVDRQKQMEKMRREFVANVSHEMKTPLCLLQMYAENLKYNVAGVDKDYYCDTIIDETQRLSEMVSSMLNLSAIENGLSVMTMVPLDFGELCREVVTRMEPVLQDVALTSRLEGSFPVEGDASYLEQAIKNYLSNAASHTPTGGKVLLNLERVGDQVRFSVGNQGEHIPEQRLERVWDSFYKVDDARVRTGETHVGLGLSIVKTVIQRHGGYCQVENTPIGVRFSFTLPLKQTALEEGTDQP